MELEGAEREELLRALLGAFPSVDELRRAVSAMRGARLESMSGTPREKLSALISLAEAEGWTQELVRGAHAAHPRHVRLHRFFLDYLASLQRSVPRASLERILGTAWDRPDEAARWRRQLAAIERKVCQVELETGSLLGTGFLVAPDLVLTNLHVIEHRRLETVRVRFDQKTLPDRMLLRPGQAHGVKRCLAQSPYSPADLMHPRPREATVHELDYALLQVAGSPGDEDVGGSPRGWVELPRSREPFSPGSLALIVQHPEARPMSVALDVFMGVSPSRTRVAYRTRTEPGSSGAPCFTKDLRLAALHHSGGPRIPTVTGHNEGIPADTIRDSLPGSVLKLLGGE